MSAHYALLEQEALLQITGPDTLSFLQGQTTCDTRQVDSGHSVPGAYCTPQGRMVCDFLLGQLGEERFALRLRADVLDTAATTFGKYIVFSKAKLAPEKRNWQVVACWGDEVADILQDLVGQLPGGRYRTVSGEGYLLIQMDEAGTGYEAWIDMENHRDHYEALQRAMQVGEADEWFALQIRAGLGRVEGPTIEEFLPQMLNFDITGHVSFNKGCYTGQEIVARLHYRGKAKRRMYLAQLDSATPPAAGTQLRGAESGQSVGTVVNSVPEGGGTICLVTATQRGLTEGLALESPPYQTLKVLELPYVVSDQA